MGALDRKRWACLNGPERDVEGVHHVPAGVRGAQRSIAYLLSGLFAANT